MEPEEPNLPARRDAVALFELDQRRANAYAASGYWPDAKSMAQALVKIEAGRAFGLSAFAAMSGVFVIAGRPVLAAAALAALVKSSSRYDYRVIEHTEERCVIRFSELGGDVLGESVFTLDDARKAGLAGRSTWKQYPRNMLFARALSNGVAWFCPDVAAGRIYTPEELDGAVVVESDTVEGEAAEERPAPAGPSLLQKQKIASLLKQLRQAAPTLDWATQCAGIAGPSDDLDEPGAERLLQQMRGWLSELRDADE